MDNTAQTPESEAYPSAVKALASAGARVGVVGAGVVGATNPEGRWARGVGRARVRLPAQEGRAPNEQPRWLHALPPPRQRCQVRLGHAL